MKFRYVRIQGKELVENTMQGKGVFAICMQMLRDDVMDEEDAGLYREIDDWFAHELPWPEPCKRQENVVCWFKTENSEMMMKMMQPVMWLLERYDHPYYVVYTNFPGEIVYEDEYQIAVKVGEDIPVVEYRHEWTGSGGSVWGIRLLGTPGP